jgi:NADH-quinone oxidoreductase subunit L
VETFDLVPWIVYFPVIGLLINLAVGRRIGERGIAITAIGASTGALVISIMQFLALRTHPEGAVVNVAEWIGIGSLSVPWAFRVDTLSVTMMLVVSGVGTLIHIYAAGYMYYDVRYKEDPGSYARFFVYLNLFIAAMMILVGGNSYLMLFVGWEGVGLCSFLLIGFWYTRNPNGKHGLENSQAAKKAFVANRVGDFGFLLAMLAIFWAFGSLTFDGVLPNADLAAPAVILFITIMMLLGVAGKSAQLPLYVWLPDAMAGPTPVSALIHAATMVTAGVYLVARTAPLFAAVPAAQETVSAVGGLTAFFAATIAVGQYDIKKVLAYSTISQLGFMVAAVGMGAFVAGMFHLVTHAFFKALLFLGSGSVILALERAHHPLGTQQVEKKGHKEEHFDPQDMRLMGGLRKRIPLTFRVYAIGALALAGIPPLAGFFSKDEILTDALHANLAVYILLTAAAFLTAFYVGRQLLLVFYGEPRSHAAEKAIESPPLITTPLVILAALSFLGGVINLPVLHPFTHWLEHTLGEDLAHPTEFNLTVALISTALALIALYLAWFVYSRATLKADTPDPLEARLERAFTGMEKKWWVDEFYNWLIIRPYQNIAKVLAEDIDWGFWHDWVHDSLLAQTFRRFARFLAEPFDLGVIDGIANGLGAITTNSAKGLRFFQTGFVRNYALVTFMGVVIMLGYLVFSS